MHKEEEAKLWNVQGRRSQAVECTRKKKPSNAMQKEDFHIVALIKACAKKKDLCNGTKLHNEILRRDLLGKCPFVASALINMYAKCGLLAQAQKVLEELPIRDVVTWSALIVGYAQHGHGHEALNCFERMKREGFSPNAVTFTGILKACSKEEFIRKGEEMHEEIVGKGLMENNTVLGNALVDMYAKCGMLKKAEQVLKELNVRDVISWSSLIAGYAHHGKNQEALNCLQLMRNEGLSPNAVTYVSILKACGNIGAIDKGKQIHEEITNMKFLDKDVMLGNALLDMYSKCGRLDIAQQVLEKLPCRDVVSWSTLISGYAQQQKY
jgi:pentatricopeptide repeat protein